LTLFSISAVAIASPEVMLPPLPPAPPAPPAPPSLVVAAVLSELCAAPPAPPRAPRAPEEEFPPVFELTDTELVTLASLLLLTLMVAAKAAGEPAKTKPKTAPVAVNFLRSECLICVIRVK
jgi:hypothetical protein